MGENSQFSMEEILRNWYKPSKGLHGTIVQQGTLGGVAVHTIMDVLASGSNVNTPIPTVLYLGFGHKHDMGCIGTINDALVRGKRIVSSCIDVSRVFDSTLSIQDFIFERMLDDNAENPLGDISLIVIDNVEQLLLTEGIDATSSLNNIMGIRELNHLAFQDTMQALNHLAYNECLHGPVICINRAIGPLPTNTTRGTTEWLRRQDAISSMCSFLEAVNTANMINVCEDINECAMAMIMMELKDRHNPKFIEHYTYKSHFPI